MLYSIKQAAEEDKMCQQVISPEQILQALS